MATPTLPSPEQAEILAARAIPVSAALALGVRSVTTPAELPEGSPANWSGWLPALLFPWTGADGRVEWQIRPDTPPVDRDDKPIKYATRSRDDGYEPVLWAARPGSVDGVHLLVEGTCQTVAAATWAPEGVTVVGMIGCRGWLSEGVPLTDLAQFGGANVVVVLDADMTSNPNVWDAGEGLSHALAAEGARVKFLRLPGSGKAGLDDVLGKRPEHQRTAHLARLIETAEPEKFPKSRRPKPAADPDSFFGDGGLRVEKLAKDIFDAHPSALTSEDKVALYRDGVYGIDGTAFIGAVAERLGDDFRPSHRAAVEEFTRGTLHRTGRTLPVHTDLPLLNMRNGMLDLATGTLKPHDPVYMSSVQFPIEWNGDAQCDAYLEWCESVGILDQLDDLEEVVSMMLDPSRTPTKAAFLFGPSRSGKSTYLRLMEAVAGIQNVSGVSLKQLSDDKHSAANVYGKALNVSADLSSAHVEDLSLFKMLTGEDLITADRKFGNQFSFRNRALFAFSANELPTVGESSRAYSERIKPFRFDRSFAGHENPAIEDQLRSELAGILVRWVKAWQRLTARRAYLPTLAAIAHEFETRSDRVRQFYAEELSVAFAPSAVLPGNSAPTAPSEGQELPADQTSTPTELATMFRSWSEAVNGPGRTLGRNKLVERLTSIKGVVRVRRQGSGQRCLNLYRRAGGDPWEGGEPPSDEGGATGAGAAEKTAGEANAQVRGGAGSFEGGSGGTAGDHGEPAESAGEANAQVRGGEAMDLPGSSYSSGTSSCYVGNTQEMKFCIDSEGVFPVVTHIGTGTAESAGGPPLRFDDDGAAGLEAVLAVGPELPAYRPADCPDCDGPMTLVPISPVLGESFWYACRSCTPRTFDR